MKKTSSVKRVVGVGLLCMNAIFFTGCMSEDYNLDNVDLTMGLGSEGLSVSVGNTEKIWLQDILEVDKTLNVDQNHLYYMVEKGETDLSLTIDKLTSDFKHSVIHTKQRVFNFDSASEQSGKPIENGTMRVLAGDTPWGKADGETDVDVDIKDIPSDVKIVRRIELADTPVCLMMNLITTPAVKLRIETLRNLSILLPKFIHVKSVSAGWKINGRELTYEGEMTFRDGDPLCEMIIDYVDLYNYGVPNAEGVITLPSELTHIKAYGEVNFVAVEDFVMHREDYADVDFTLQMVQDAEVQVNRVTGLFNPAINPDLLPIEIAASLPDFLKDEKVRIPAVNPTIKIKSDMRSIPVGLHFGANLIARKQGEGAFERSVELPKVPINPYTFNTIYYYQGTSPYDPEGVEQGAVAQPVGNIAQLIEQLPDCIDVNMKNQHITVQDKEYTIEVGHTYKAKAEYSVYIPFEFENGLVVVYNDSTNSFGNDLQDYAAKGIRVSAQIDNTIPLELAMTAYAIDRQGNSIEGVHFSEVEVHPSEDGHTLKTTSIELDGDLDNPKLLRQIDRICFKIHATADKVQDNSRLFSTQYLRVRDMKLKLKGIVIADFN